MLRKVIGYGFMALLFLGLVVKPALVQGEATQAATPSAALAPAVEKAALTEPVEAVVKPLEKLLKEQSLGSFSWHNFFKYAIRQAVSAGVPANTIVLLLLLPLLAALIAAARHFLGIAGFGIFTPAMISVTFLATGISSGIILFLVALLMAAFSRMMLKKLKVHYLPRMAILLWFICLGIFVVIFIFPRGEFIVAVYFFITLKCFIEVQTGRSMREAVGMTIETLIIALGGYFLMNWKFLQGFVLLNPEISVLGVLLFNILVGKYTGFRFLEYRRFRAIMKK